MISSPILDNIQIYSTMSRNEKLKPIPYMNTLLDSETMVLTLLGAEFETDSSRPIILFTRGRRLHICVMDYIPGMENK